MNDMADCLRGIFTQPAPGVLPGVVNRTHYGVLCSRW